MCGILYGHRRDGHPVAKSLLKRYAAQKNRGQRGFGYIAIGKNGKVQEVRRFEGPTDFENALGKETAATILAHHRLPTSTPNYEEATHPIHVSNNELTYDYYVIHNGVITNPDELKRVHEKLGYRYTTELEEIHTIKSRKGKRKTYQTSCFNDSEALAVEVARFLDGKSETMAFRGSAAIIALKCEKDGTVLSTHYMRNDGNPMKVENNNALFYLKSEGEGDDLLVDTLVSVDFRTGATERKNVEVGETFRAKKLDSLSDPYYDRPRIGFRERDRDDDDAWDWGDLPFRRSIKSPYQPDDQGRLLEYANEPEDQQELHFEYEETDYSEQFAEYSKTEDYLCDLWDEIKELKKDIAACTAVLESGSTSWPDMDNRNYSEDYLDECKRVLEARQREADNLEKYLAGTV